jgi:hypothetical protein
MTNDQSQEPKVNHPLDDLSYLQQAKAHADEGVIGNAAAVSILDIAEAATLRCRRMAQTIYLHCSEEEIRKSLPESDANYVIARRGGSVDYEPGK